MHHHMPKSEQQAERIKSSGVGLLTTWSPTIYFKSSVYIPISCLDSILRMKMFYRQMDGSLRMEVLIVLRNLLEVASFVRFFFSSKIRLGVYRS